MTIVTNIIDLTAVWSEENARTANQNFRAIAEKAGVFTSALNMPITVPSRGWSDARAKQKYRDVQKPDDLTLSVIEDAENVIAGRAVVDVYIPDPETVRLKYTYVLLLPYVDNTPANVANRKTIAQCGIDLVEHTAFNNLGDGGVAGKKKLCLLLQAVDAIPTTALQFNVLLF